MLHGRSREVIAGLTLATIGLYFFLGALTYPLGSLRHMDAGYFPMVVGLLTVGVGALITVSPPVGTSPAPAWRPLFSVVIGIALFGWLVRPFGLIPASFAAAAFAGLGDRKARPKSILIVAALVSIFAWMIFGFGLQLPVQALRWPA